MSIDRQAFEIRQHQACNTVGFTGQTSDRAVDGVGLRLIYGRAGSGKSTFCLDEIKQRRDSGVKYPLLLLVPEQVSFKAEKNLIGILKGIGVTGADVLTFKRMAYRVFSEVGGIARKHIDTIGKSILLFSIIETLQDKLKIFSRAAKQQGFLDTVIQTITEFKRYDITPDRLQIIIDKLRDDELIKIKLEDIKEVYGLFERELKAKGYIDVNDDLIMLAEKLELSRQFDGSEIWIDGFAEFTPQDYKIIEKLLHKAQRVNITLCTDCLEDTCSIDHSELFYPIREIGEKLLKLAKKNAIEVEQTVYLDQVQRFQNSRDLQHLEKYFFSFPYKTYLEPTENLRLFTAANQYTEVESTAREIIRLCRDCGLRYRDIAVVTRDLDAYKKIIPIVFAAHDIPHFIDQKREISSHPVIRLCLSALEIFVYNWSYETVFRYLKTGTTGIPDAQIDIIENYVLANGIKGNRWLQKDGWVYPLNGTSAGKTPSENDLQMLQQINRTREEIVSPLAKLHAQIRGKKTIRQICMGLYEFLCELSIPQMIEARIEEFEAEGEIDLAKEYGQIWDALVQVLDQMVEVSGNETAQAEYFLQALTIGFAECEIGMIPTTMDQVVVGELEDARNQSFKALLVIGVNDGVFPAVSAEKGIISDAERQLLQMQGVELAQDSKVKTFAEQYLAYTVLSSPSRYLRLSYPIADSDGRSKRPSAFISRLHKLFPELYIESDIIDPIEGNDLLQNLTLLSSPAAGLDKLVYALRREKEGYTMHPIWWDVYHWYASKPEWDGNCHEILKGFDYTNQVSDISPDRVEKLYESPIRSSVSRLENFAACPFAHYVQYGLKASERKIHKLSALDLGTFMHYVIDKFVNVLQEKELDWDSIERQQCEELICEIIDDYCREELASILVSSARYRYITERLKRILTRAAWMVVNHIKHSDFKPLGTEVAFGDDAKYPAITIDIPSGGQLKLRGKIDRVDSFETGDGIYLRVVDYKSGKKAFKLSDFYYGLQLQLLTYLDALLTETQNTAQAKTTVPAGILYFRLDDPVVKGKVDALEEDIEKNIMKQLRMRGLLLEDTKLLTAMDRSIASGGESLMIPARLNKDGTISKTSAVATAENFSLLRKHLRKYLVEIGEEIYKGNIAIKPYKKGSITPCGFCAYPSVCQFDQSFPDNSYRAIRERKDEEVWEMLAQNDAKGVNEVEQA